MAAGRKAGEKDDEEEQDMGTAEKGGPTTMVRWYAYHAGQAEAEQENGRGYPWLAKEEAIRERHFHAGGDQTADPRGDW